MLIFLVDTSLYGRTYAIPEPIGRCGETDSARTNREREDLTDNYPCRRTPCHSETGYIETDESDHSRDGCGVVLRVQCVGFTW